MEKDISRRGFLIKSVITMGTVVVYNFSIAYSDSASKASEAQDLKEDIMPHVSVKMYPGPEDQGLTSPRRGGFSRQIANGIMEW